jgi:nicotinate-nucleotide pyrophosphorylase (carboxylating)
VRDRHGDAGARAVLIDNFTLEDAAAAVARCREAGEVFVEASGGVRIDTIAAIARTGVDAIAVGGLTHSVRGLDIGLDVVADPEGS